MLRSLRRASPAALLFAGLALAGFRPQGPASRPDAADQAASLPCDLTLARWGGGSYYALGATTRLVQPLPDNGNVVACTLAVNSPSLTPPYLSAHLEQWDPATLAPDPTTASFRSQFYESSPLVQATRLSWDLSPMPLVTRSLPGVADGRPGTVALEVTESRYYLGNPFAVAFDSAGSAALSAAFASENGNPFATLPGPHPVLWQVVCGQDASTQMLRVLQAVMTTGAVLDTSWFQVAQRFRVPDDVGVLWVEIVPQAGGVRGTYDGGTIQIFPADQQASPNTALGAPMAQGAFSANPPPSPGAWCATAPLDAAATLHPGHDYWLVVQTNHDQAMVGRYVSVSPTPAFADGVGPLFARTDGSLSWQQAFNEALDFRLIGLTMNADAVPPPVASAGALRLSAAPNPASGEASIAWAGARGPVRVEVLDVRGRRLDALPPLAGAEGRWIWSGSTASGARLPAGVYFLRATDAGGQSAVTRVVLAR